MINTAGRFYLIVCTITVVSMYLIIVHLVPLVLHTWGTIPKFVITVTSSLAVFRLIAWGVDIVLRKWVWLRAKVFGPSFLHGTWIGYFRGHNNDLRYVVEHFEQDFDGLVIRGQSFDRDGREHAHWTSTSASIDPVRGVLSYLSSCDIMTRNVTEQSVCIFQIKRDDKSDCAHGISGYAVDVNDGVRIAVIEQKLDKKLLPFSEALSQAMEMAADANA
ncbi:hypothetical protein ATS72_015595 [Pseudoalteromonas sp. 13-15]|uniref:hypothetical protein n=1 Tax=Pseudoalteromonas TaxID=53246 RepID=UPI00072FBD2A|nr:MULTISPECIES: hypothetical protein [Pseudoalteromonas]AUL75060.1 hypothetical protein ATS72_015595 [Pseudoalteromonas sp. 13-15]WFO21094.1 hypothetical protein ATS73_017270 [Pseudoalteromonas sp. H100]SIO19542.1 hypothetical protein SAMN05878071_3131 [Pseudoalteromonas marina]